MIIYCLFLILFALGGGAIVFLILRNKIKITQQTNSFIQQENEKAYQKYNELEQLNSTLLNNYNQTSLQYNQLKIDESSLLSKIESMNTTISNLERQAQEAAEVFYKDKIETAQEQLKNWLIQETQKYQDSLDECEKQYTEKVLDWQQKYEEYVATISQFRAIADAAVEAAKRAEQTKDQQNFYRIQLSDLDIREIQMLREIEPYLREKEPLNKVIWKCYYEKPTSDLIGRVIGTGVHTGIYKITEIATSKCYVGQARNLSDRWKQHIKRAVGAETPTKNKLYPAMQSAGPENFTFEVIEECDAQLLDEREDYWQDYYHAKDFGLSIK